MSELQGAIDRIKEYGGGMWPNPATLLADAMKLMQAAETAAATIARLEGENARLRELLAWSQDVHRIEWSERDDDFDETKIGLAISAVFASLASDEAEP